MLRHHEPSGLAVVALNGQDFYCGSFKRKASLAEYNCAVAEQLQTGLLPISEVEITSITNVE